MNPELQKNFSFPCVLVCADAAPWINHYDVEIQMRVTTTANSDYNTAYDRIKFWFQDVMHGAVLINSSDARLQVWRETGMTCLDFPQNPVDQVVGLMLMSKLTAMVENRLEILRVAITSSADDYVTYLCDHMDNLHWFEEPGWWKDSGPTHATDLRRVSKSGKVISLSPVQDWKQHNLDWGPATDQAANVATVTSFTKNDSE